MAFPLLYPGGGKEGYSHLSYRILTKNYVRRSVGPFAERVWSRAWRFLEHTLFVFPGIWGAGYIPVSDSPLGQSRLAGAACDGRVKRGVFRGCSLQFQSFVGQRCHEP